MNEDINWLKTEIVRNLLLAKIDSRKNGKRLIDKALEHFTKLMELISNKKKYP